MNIPQKFQALNTHLLTQEEEISYIESQFILLTVINKILYVTNN